MSSRLYEVARFYSFTSITYNPITLLVNEPFYRALPQDIRETVDRSAADALAYQSEVARQMEADALEQMRASGVEISRPNLRRSHRPSDRSSGTSWPIGYRTARR